MKIPKDLSPEDAREFARAEEEHRRAGVEHQREEEFRERLAASEREHRLCGNLIFAYTRRQALKDGVLTDVTQFARALGVKYPMVVTASVWVACIGSTGRFGEELPGLWRLLGKFVAAAKVTPSKGGRMTFRATGREDGAAPVEVIVDLGPDDDGAPCLTLMLREDD